MSGRIRVVVFRAFVLANLALTLALLAHSALLPGQSLFQPQVPAEQTEFPTISIADASKLIEDSNTVFVDARAGKVYDYGHVPHALSLPLGSSPSADLLARLRSADTIVVYCDGPHCDASHGMAVALRGEGLSRILLMRDGWQGWLAGGLPVVNLSH